MKLTRNFSRDEFSHSSTAERNHINNTIPYALMENVIMVANWLQILRDRLRKEKGKTIYVTISSGYRCKKLNKILGGSKTSEHVEGLAADIHATGFTSYELAMFIKANMRDCPFDQCILEFDKWVHVGFKKNPSKNRRQLLESYKGEDIFGKIITKYKPLLMRRDS